MAVDSFYKMQLNDFIKRLHEEVNETKKARVKLSTDSRFYKNQYKQIRENVKLSLTMRPAQVQETFKSQPEELSKTV